MRRSSKQLIADLVEGRSENPTEAMETIVRSPRLRAAYEEQLAARQALIGLEPVSMTEQERAGLRRDVWTSLTAATPAAKVAAPRGLRVAGAAAVLAVVVGGGALLMQSMGGAGGGDNADLVTAGEALSGDVTTTVRTSQTLGTEIDSENGGQAPERVETEDLLRRQAEIIRNKGVTTFSLAGEEVRCVELDELEGLRPVAKFELEGTEYQAWVPVGTAPDEIDENTPLVFVDVETCTIQPVTQ